MTSRRRGALTRHARDTRGNGRGDREPDKKFRLFVASCTVEPRNERLYGNVTARSNDKIVVSSCPPHGDRLSGKNEENNNDRNDRKHTVVLYVHEYVLVRACDAWAPCP